MYLQKLLPYLYNGNPNSLAAAFATARETPRMAFAPNFDLFMCHLNQSSGQSRFVQN
jgi:hypothetical protein